MKATNRERVISKFVEELIEDKLDDNEALNRINEYTDALAQDIYKLYDDEVEALKFDKNRGDLNE